MYQIIKVSLTFKCIHHQNDHIYILYIQLCSDYNATTYVINYLALIAYRNAQYI